MTDQSEDRRIVEAATQGAVENLVAKLREPPNRASYVMQGPAPLSKLLRQAANAITALLNNEKAQAEEIERLRAALNWWECQTCKGYGRSYYDGETHTCTACAGTGKHPIARAALTTKGTGQ